jgi:hypothetical protein
MRWHLKAAPLPLWHLKTAPLPPSIHTLVCYHWAKIPTLSSLRRERNLLPSRRSCGLKRRTPRTSETAACGNRQRGVRLRSVALATAVAESLRATGAQADTTATQAQRVSF